jgi:pimeloyl-ACP methyl ester carboxylesterase
VGLIDELGLADVVLGGYDDGSRIAQTVARAAPERVRALVLAGVRGGDPRGRGLNVPMQCLGAWKPTTACCSARRRARSG